MSLHDLVANRLLGFCLRFTVNAAFPGWRRLGEEGSALLLKTLAATSRLPGRKQARQGRGQESHLLDRRIRCPCGRLLLLSGRLQSWRWPPSVRVMLPVSPGCPG